MPAFQILDQARRYLLAFVCRNYDSVFKYCVSECLVSQNSRYGGTHLFKSLRAYFFVSEDTCDEFQLRSLPRMTGRTESESTDSEDML